MRDANRQDPNKVGREIACPFCESTDNELLSIFGQTLLGSIYYCRDCRTAFEAVRFDDKDLQQGARSDE